MSAPDNPGEQGNIAAGQVPIVAHHMAEANKATQAAEDARRQAEQLRGRG